MHTAEKIAPPDEELAAEDPQHLPDVPGRLPQPHREDIHIDDEHDTQHTPLNAEDGIDAEDASFLYPWTAPTMDIGLIRESLESKLMNINEHDADMKEKLTDILAVHVPEFYSPPKVTAMACSFGLTSGTAYDLTVRDSNGLPWDVGIREQREHFVHTYSVRNRCYGLDHRCALHSRHGNT